MNLLLKSLLFLCACTLARADGLFIQVGDDPNPPGSVTHYIVYEQTEDVLVITNTAGNVIRQTNVISTELFRFPAVTNVWKLPEFQAGKHCLAVTALGQNNWTSDYSDAFCLFKAFPPANVTAQNLGDGVIELTWEDWRVTNPIEADVDGYVIYHAVDGEPIHELARTNGNVFQTTIGGGQTQFAVACYNSFGPGPRTAAVTIVRLLPVTDVTVFYDPAEDRVIMEAIGARAPRIQLKKGE